MSSDGRRCVAMSLWTPTEPYSGREAPWENPQHEGRRREVSSDGSVVLKAESTLFRVHISQLVRRSLFFQDIFSLSQPENSSVGLDGTFDGCPLLVLYDSAEDLSNLLKALQST